MVSYKVFWGLGYYVNHQIVSLPLLDVNATVSIKDLAAQVKLVQAFTNEAAISVDAMYSFPVPARAAVSGFTLIKEDGTRVLGIVQEKAEAQKTYDDAVSEGKLASLMVQQTPDVFQVSVGNILAKEKVTIELVYSTELTEDEDNDSIRFHLPAHIGTRYGQAPSGYRQPQTLDIHVAISVESLSPIRKISCPSHSVSVELGPDPTTASNLPFSNYARVSLASDSALDKDFVLAVEATGLDSPRCLAEVHPTNETIGMALTLVPKFHLPDPITQEFIFLVDRSGSMQGSRMAAARKALVIMLRSLPRKNTFFQIVSFGSRSSALWSQGSRLYDQETLDEATRHVDSMEADFGGTEIRAGLEMSFEKRMSDRPTSVFLLTDGDAWDLNGVLDTVKAKVEAVQSKSAYLRVFTFGIGDSASTAMCEGIARAGNGASMMVGEKEATMTGKITRLVKAARTPPILDISIDWGRDDDSKTLAGYNWDDFEMVSKEDEKVQKTSAPKFNIFNQTANPLENDFAPIPPAAPVVLGPPPRVQQTPYKLRNLFPGVRIYAYAILQGSATVPQTVIIRGKTPDGVEIELPVPVTPSRLPGTTAVHSLAARKIIQDLEDGRYDESLKSNVTFDLASIVKVHIVRLGKTYSISSKHTSFVAVDESSADQERLTLYRAAKSAPATSAGQHEVLQNFFQSRLTPVQPAPAQQGLQGAAAPDLAFLGFTFKRFASQPGPAPSLSSVGASVATPDSLIDFDDVAHKSFDMKIRPDSMSHDELGDDLLSVSTMASGNQHVLQSASSSIQIPNIMDHQKPKEVMDPLEALARLQSFDGGFTMQVLDVIKLQENSVRAAFPELQDPVIATVVAMAFIASKLKDRQTQDIDAWNGIYEKAKEYIEDQGDLNIEELLKKATSLGL